MRLICSSLNENTAIFLFSQWFLWLFVGVIRACFKKKTMGHANVNAGNVWVYHISKKRHQSSANVCFCFPSVTVSKYFHKMFVNMQRKLFDTVSVFCFFIPTRSLVVIVFLSCFFLNYIFYLCVANVLY